MKNSGYLKSDPDLVSVRNSGYLNSSPDFWQVEIGDIRTAVVVVGKAETYDILMTVPI